MKLNIIAFDEFMTKSNVEELINVPPEIFEVYVTLGSLGVIAIGLSLLEYRLAKRGKHIQADRIKTILKYGLPITFITFLLYFVFYSRAFIMEGGL